MKSSELHHLWRTPVNSRLTSRQYSFRLPVHVAAKLAALVDMFPNKTRTEILGDLLSTAITEVIAGLPSSPAEAAERHPELSLSDYFWTRADLHFKALEQELGNPLAPDIRHYHNTDLVNK